MPEIFDVNWASGPFGPFPLILYSETEVGGDQYVLLAPASFADGGVYVVPGAIVQYCSPTGGAAGVRFRRTLFPRVGSRGEM
jgi:hypothetical protein